MRKLNGLKESHCCISYDVAEDIDMEYNVVVKIHNMVSPQFSEILLYTEECV